uniref:hypothetical protein n=1 Tax=Algoriphagus sp. TaxID=1872435 RepID=UPI0040471E82
MRKFLAFFLFLFFLVIVAYAQRDWGGMSALEDDEEIKTLKDVGFGIISGGVCAGIGFVLMQIKAIKLLGQVLIFLGAFVAIGGVAIYLLQILEIIVSTVLYFAFYAALIIGGIYLVTKILVEIYEWLTKRR